jgi:class 3 adenylate cyclase
VREWARGGPTVQARALALGRAGSGALSRAGAASADPLEAGRAAAERHAWAEAFESLTAADESQRLSARDLEALAQAAWWTGRLDECIAARERAFAAYLDEEHPCSAALVALGLAKDNYAKQASAVGNGWLKRAERLLHEEAESIEHGYLARFQGVMAFEGTGDHERALEKANRTLEIATRFGDRDLQAVAIQDQGRALVASGRVAEGLSLLDESTLAAVSGELSPMATGTVYCNMISTCEELGDYRRAGEWTEAATRWCERQAIAGFPGTCRVHRASIMRLRGAWPEAEHEARVARDELQEFNLSAAAEAFYEIGEVRLRVGDLEAAEDAFTRANELGRDPQPGLAMLRFAEGKLESALSSIRRALKETHGLARGRLLPTQIELSIAAGELEDAGAAMDELEEIAARYASAGFEASAVSAGGALSLAAGRTADAVQALRSALRLWRDIDFPYEAARTRVQLARAYREEGDHESAVLELRSAGTAFEELGALPDARRAADTLAEWQTAAGAAGEPIERRTTTFVFTDIVSSTRLVEAIGDEAWDDLVSWHDRTLRSLFARHGGQEIDHTGDGFFVAFDEPAAAVACAVAVQRTLAEHRRSAGFAPPVRIGIHAAQATRTAGNYRGRGVHEAARIAGLATGSEIVASTSTLDSVDIEVVQAAPREVSLRGLSEPVEVVTIVWS